jgi:hypothetical protein
MFQMGDSLAWPGHPVAGAFATVAVASCYAVVLLHRLSRTWMRSLR